MKLRMKGNSIRMRLTKSEIAEIKSGHSVSESVQFANAAQLIYKLTPSDRSEVIAAQIKSRATEQLSETTIEVMIPTQTAQQWASSETVSLSNGADPSEGSLFILVEKDFFCLKPRSNEHEDESDMFDNPNEAHGSCG